MCFAVKIGLDYSLQKQLATLVVVSELPPVHMPFDPKLPVPSPTKIKHIINNQNMLMKTGTQAILKNLPSNKNKLTFLLMKKKHGITIKKLQSVRL